MHLAFAAYRRGHDVAFASVDAFSQGEGSDIVAEVVRPKSGRLRDTAGYAKALTAADAPREAARLVDFDVIFLRNNPSAGAAEVDAFNPALDFGRRLKQLGRAGGQRPGRPVARRVEDVPGRLSGRAAARRR